MPKETSWVGLSQLKSLHFLSKFCILPFILLSELNHWTNLELTLNVGTSVTICLLDKYPLISTPKPCNFLLLFPLLVFFGLELLVDWPIAFNLSRLSGNRFSGSIPTELNEASSLSFLELGSNGFSTIPDYSSFPSFYSDFVDTQCHPCDSNPCLYGANCTENLGDCSFQCECYPGFSGSICETVDFCGPSPCRNGGSCTNNGDSFSCNCPTGWTGDTCITPDFCAAGPCAEGSTCVNEPDRFSCICPLGFNGTRCESFFPFLSPPFCFCFCFFLSASSLVQPLSFFLFFPPTSSRYLQFGPLCWGIHLRWFGNHISLRLSHKQLWASVSMYFFLLLKNISPNIRATNTMNSFWCLLCFSLCEWTMHPSQQHIFLWMRPLLHGWHMWSTRGLFLSCCCYHRWPVSVLPLHSPLSWCRFGWNRESRRPFHPPNNYHRISPSQRRQRKRLHQHPFFWLSNNDPRIILLPVLYCPNRFPSGRHCHGTGRIPNPCWRWLGRVKSYIGLNMELEDLRFKWANPSPWRQPSFTIWVVPCDSFVWWNQPLSLHQRPEGNRFALTLSLLHLSHPLPLLRCLLWRLCFVLLCLVRFRCEHPTHRSVRLKIRSGSGGKEKKGGWKKKRKRKKKKESSALFPPFFPSSSFIACKLVCLWFRRRHGRVVSQQQKVAEILFET